MGMPMMIMHQSDCQDKMDNHMIDDREISTEEFLPYCTSIFFSHYPSQHDQSPITQMQDTRRTYERNRRKFSKDQKHKNNLNDEKQSQMCNYLSES